MYDFMSTDIEKRIINKGEQCQKNQENHYSYQTTCNLFNDQHTNDDGEQNDSIINEIIFHGFTIYLNKRLNDAGMGETNSIGS